MYSQYYIQEGLDFDKSKLLIMFQIIHRTNRVMAVKRIRSTVDEKEQKQLLMDLEVVMKSNECVYIVQFYGALFKEVRLYK